MYLRPPSASEEARINDWIKVRQSGIKYYLSLGDQRIVDKNFIIRPKAEFEVNVSTSKCTIKYLIVLGALFFRCLLVWKSLKQKHSTRYDFG